MALWCLISGTAVVVDARSEHIAAFGSSTTLQIRQYVSFRQGQERYEISPVFQGSQTKYLHVPSFKQSPGYGFG